MRCGEIVCRQRLGVLAHNSLWDACSCHRAEQLTAAEPDGDAAALARDKLDELVYADEYGCSCDACYRVRAPLVLEIGASCTKIGFSGDCRRAVIPSVVGYFDQSAAEHGQADANNDASDSGDHATAVVGDAALACPWLRLGSVCPGTTVTSAAATAASMVLDPVEWLRTQSLPSQDNATATATARSSGSGSGWRSRLTGQSARQLAVQGYHALSKHSSGSGDARSSSSPSASTIPVEHGAVPIDKEEQYSVELQRAGGIGILLGTMLDHTPYVMGFTGNRQAESLGVGLKDRIIEVAGIDVRATGETGVVQALKSTSSSVATTVVFVFVRNVMGAGDTGGGTALAVQPTDAASAVVNGTPNTDARLPSGDEGGGSPEIVSVPVPSGSTPTVPRLVSIDWKRYETMWRHTYYDVMSATPAHHPLVLVEPTICPPKAVRDRLFKLAFDVLHISQLYLAPAPTLALLSASAPESENTCGGSSERLLAMQTGMVVRCGTYDISAVAVVGGYIMPHTLRRLGVGGALLASVCMLPSLKRAGWISSSMERQRDTAATKLLEELGMVHPTPRDVLGEGLLPSLLVLLRRRMDHPWYKSGTIMKLMRIVDACACLTVRSRQPQNQVERAFTAEMLATACGMGVAAPGVGSSMSPARRGSCVARRWSVSALNVSPLRSGGVRSATSVSCALPTCG